MLEWKQNDKGNWVTDTPSGSTMVVFKRDDKWNYSCTKRGAMNATFGVKLYDNAEDLMSWVESNTCLLYTSPSPRDRQKSRMPSSA